MTNPAHGTGPRERSDPVVGRDVLRIRPGEADAPRSRDEIAREVPLELRFGAAASLVILRTPGDDEDLVRGLLFAEGFVAGPDDIVSMRPAEPSDRSLGGDALDVMLLPSIAAEGLDRPLASTAACGACGKRSLADLAVRAAPLQDRFTMPRETIAALPASLRAAQAGFSRTGGMHASGLFDGAGGLVALREDVGRHNALDKVVGFALRRRWIPLHEKVLVVSGRIGFELVQKAVVAGAPMLVAVGAPSSLAIDLAERHGLTLIGFTRAEAFNVYTHAQRVGP